MSDLEGEYRKALSRYPRAWRRRHEDALIGVLLDNAEAEGRRYMSKTDRQDLALNGRRLRVAHALPATFFAVAALAMLFLVVMVLSGTPLDVRVIMMPPAIPATPIGGSYQPLFAIQQPVWVIYAATVGVLVVTTVLGLLLVRRNIRVDRAD